jgi:hypothetical protein
LNVRFVTDASAALFPACPALVPALLKTFVLQDLIAVAMIAIQLPSQLLSEVT